VNQQALKHAIDLSHYHSEDALSLYLRTLSDSERLSAILGIIRSSPGVFAVPGGAWEGALSTLSGAAKQTAVYSLLSVDGIHNRLGTELERSLIASLEGGERLVCLHKVLARARTYNDDDAIDWVLQQQGKTESEAELEQRLAKAIKDGSAQRALDIAKRLGRNLAQDEVLELLQVLEGHTGSQPVEISIWLARKLRGEVRAVELNRIVTHACRNGHWDEALSAAKLLKRSLTDDEHKLLLAHAVRAGWKRTALRAACELERELTSVEVMQMIEVKYRINMLSEVLPLILLLPESQRADQYAKLRTSAVAQSFMYMLAEVASITNEPVQEDELRKMFEAAAETLCDGYEVLQYWVEHLDELRQRKEHEPA